MNVNAILFLQASDLTHFAKVQDHYRGVRRLFIDPGLIEVAVREGVELEPFSFVPPEFDLHLQARVASEASIHAAHLDLALTKLRRDVFGEGVFQGWDQSLLRQFFLRATLFRELGSLCDAQFAPGRVGLFRPENPQLFYFDSFVATDMFSSTSSRWHVVQGYEEASLWNRNSYSNVFDAAAVRELALKGADCVAHLPATYRHIAECLPQISATFKGIIDLPSAFWDIPVSRRSDLSCSYSELDSPTVPESCFTYRERARSIFEDHLSRFLPHRFGVSLQSGLFAERAFMQAVNFHGLRDALRGTKPHFLLTDHDTGNNGPLFSVAQWLGSSITVIPHSSYVTGVIPHAEQVVAVERDGFRTQVRTSLGEYVPTRGVRFGRQLKRRPRSQVSTVCLLLNGIVSNGLFHLDFVGITKFFKTLNERCLASGVKLVIRLKPSASGLGLISGALGVASERLEQMLEPSIEEVAEATDLCISFGQPTSAMINFLEAGCLLIHVGRQHWPADSAWAPAFVGDGTVTSFLPPDALALIDCLFDDTAEFQAIVERQSNQFQGRLCGGRGIFEGSLTADASPDRSKAFREAVVRPLPVSPLAQHSRGHSSLKISGLPALTVEKSAPDPTLWAAAIAAIPRCQVPAVYKPVSQTTPAVSPAIPSALGRVISG